MIILQITDFDFAILMQEPKVSSRLLNTFRLPDYELTLLYFKQRIWTDSIEEVIMTLAKKAYTPKKGNIPEIKYHFNIKDEETENLKRKQEIQEIDELFDDP